MCRVREERKLLSAGVNLPIDAGTCGRLVHDGYQRCIHCTRRRWWLLTRALNPAEVSSAAMLEEHAAESDALYGVLRWLLAQAFNVAEVSCAMPDSDALHGAVEAVPHLEEDIADSCLRCCGSEQEATGSPVRANSRSQDAPKPLGSEPCRSGTYDPGTHRDIKQSDDRDPPDFGP